MPRSRGLSSEVVVERAMVAFWTSGYAGTSLAALEAAVGLGRSSLYQEHPSKRALYLAALDRYEAIHVRPALAGLREPGAGARTLRNYLEQYAHRLASGTPRGCFLAAALAELGQHDPDVRRVGVAHQDQVSGALAEALRGAATNSRAFAAAGRASRAASVTLLGLGVLARIDPGAAAEGCAELAEALLGR